MKTEGVKIYGGVPQKGAPPFFLARKNLECYLKFFQITGTFFDFNLVLYIEGMNELLLSEILFLSNVISMKQIYYRYLGMMMTG